MSTVTHVIAALDIDTDGIDGLNKHFDFYEKLNKTPTDELKVHWFVKAESSSIRKIIVTAVGDLRDFGDNQEDIDEIMDYFKGICKDQIVEQGVVRINIEYTESTKTVVYNWSNYDGEFVQCHSVDYEEEVKSSKSIYHTMEQ